MSFTIKKLEAAGFYFLRSGHDHDVYTNGKKKEAVPRHKEVNEVLAKAILKRNGIK